MNILKQQRNEKIAADYRRHHSPKMLMEKYRLSHEMIRIVLKKQGIKLLAEKKKKTGARNKAIIEAFKNGEKISVIAHHFNRSKNFISNILTVAGVNPKRKLVAIRNEKILKDIIQGHTYGHISKKHNVNPATVCQIGKKNGINKRTEMRDKIRRMLKNEHTQARIADHLSRSHQSA